MKSNASRILIVDDHEIVREGLRTLLGQSHRNWEICGEASNGQEAIEAVRSLAPDLVVLDISMPGISGLQALATIRREGFKSPVLIFTMHESARLAGEIQHAGGQGYVLKSQAARDLVLAIEALFSGGTFFNSPPQAQSKKEGDPSAGILFCLSLIPSFG